MYPSSHWFEPHVRSLKHAPVQPTQADAWHALDAVTVGVRDGVGDDDGVSDGVVVGDAVTDGVAPRDSDGVGVGGSTGPHDPSAQYVQ